MALLLDSLFASVAWGHFIVDLINSQFAILLAFLSGPLGLTNAIIGLASMIYSSIAAAAQPVFGWLTDRFGPRWSVVGGILWMAVFFSLGVVIPGRTALIFLVLASVGSGAFHPAASMEATLRGRDLLSGHEVTAASLFFVSGQLGFFIGPILGGPLLDRFGVPGLLMLGLFALPVSFGSARTLRDTAPHGDPLLKPVITSSVKITHLPPLSGSITCLILVSAFQSWVQGNMGTFIPKMMNDLGISPGVYGFLTALFMGGSAVGNLAGGWLADRLGRRWVILTALCLDAVPLVLVGLVGYSPWLYLLVPLAGGLNGAAFSSIVVIAQGLIPGGMGLASGLVLGFIFSSGAIGTFVSGLLADRFGFPPIFYLSGVMALAGGVLALGLRDRERQAQA